MSIRLCTCICAILFTSAKPSVQAEEKHQSDISTTDEVHLGPAFNIGSPAFRFFHDEGHPRRILFSPDSRTLYRVEWTRLTAIDTQTAVILFQRKLPGMYWFVFQDAEGLRLESLHDRQCVVLHPRTGKELRTGPNQVVHFGPDRHLKRIRRIHQIRKSNHAIVEQNMRGGWRAISIRDRKTDQEIWNGGGRSWSLSADGKLLAAYRSNMEIVDTGTGEVLHRFGEIPLRVGAAKGYVAFHDVTWTDDGSQLFYTRRFKGGIQVRVFDLTTQTNRAIVSWIPMDAYHTRGNGHSRLGSPVVSHDGMLIAHLTFDQQFERRWILRRVSDSSIAKELPPLPIATRGYFSPDSSVFWMASPFGIVKYDIGEDRIDPRSLDAITPLTAVSFSPDNKQLLGVRNGEVICWNAASGKECRERRKVNEGIRLKRGRQCIHVSSDGEHTTWSDQPTMGYNGVPRLNAISCSTATPTNGKFGLPQCGVVLSRNGLQILRNKRNAAQIDLQSGKVVRELPPRNGLFDSVMAMSRDGKFVARVSRFPYQRKRGDLIDFEVCDFDGRIRGLCKLKVIEGRDQVDRTNAPMIPTYLSDTGTELLVWYRGLFSVFDVPQRQVIAAIRAKAPTERNGISPNGHRFIRIENGQLQICDIYTQKVCQAFTCRGLHPTTNTVFAFTSTGSQLAIAIPNAPVAFYNIYLQHESDREFDKLSLEALWTKLREGRSQDCFRAVCSFIRRREKSVAFLSTKLQIDPVSKDQMLDLVAQLNDREFEVCQAAHRKLTRLGAAARNHLRSVSKSNLSVEQQKRIESLLDIRHVWPCIGSIELSQLYALEILQVLDSPKSRQVLLGISQAYDGRIGRLAKVAIEDSM